MKIGIYGASKAVQSLLLTLSIMPAHTHTILVYVPISQYLPRKK